MDRQTIEFDIALKRKKLLYVAKRIEVLQEEYAAVTMEIADLVDALKRRTTTEVPA